MTRLRSAAWRERELLREKGQFWTPDWIADAMVAYVTATAARVCDPAFGAGSFALAASRLALATGRHVEFCGFELDERSLLAAKSAGVQEEDLRGVQIRDFLDVGEITPPVGFVANPPYVRHHRLSPETKARLRQQTWAALGQRLDGRAGLHVHFLVHALTLLGQALPLAFIVPADTCEGVFATTLWRWIAANFRLDAVLTFTPEATPFPGVDTNPVILLIRRLPPKPSYTWARIAATDGQMLSRWIAAGLPESSNQRLIAVRRSLADGLTSGVAREPRTPVPSIPLRSLVRIMRGVATGANDFFWLTSHQVKELRIPGRFLLRAVGRTRDVPGDRLTLEDLDKLDRDGRPTFLFTPDGRPVSEFPEPVRQRLETGRAAGLPTRPLIGQRKPWYRMENRTPPPFLFAYLGRRRARFIRNLAGAVPLTGFLCVYPEALPDGFIPQLEQLLQDPEVLGSLPLVAKTYGAGAIKVEPRSLERLPIPLSALERAGFPESFIEERALSEIGGQVAMALS